MRTYAPKTADVTSLFSEVGHGDGDVTYTEVVAYGRHRFQIRIRRNSSDFQSSAIIERWDGAKWQGTAAIHFSKMDTLAAVHLYRPETHVPTSFAVDREELLSRAMAIVGGRNNDDETGS